MCDHPQNPSGQTLSEETPRFHVPLSFGGMDGVGRDGQHREEASLGLQELEQAYLRGLGSSPGHEAWDPANTPTLQKAVARDRHLAICVHAEKVPEHPGRVCTHHGPLKSRDPPSRPYDIEDRTIKLTMVHSG